MVPKRAAKAIRQSDKDTVAPLTEKPLQGDRPTPTVVLKTLDFIEA
jgi:hypothetical protein